MAATFEWNATNIERFHGTGLTAPLRLIQICLRPNFLKQTL